MTDLPPRPDKTQRVVYRAFQDITSYLDDLYHAYRDAYSSVPIIRYEQDLTDRPSFEYCQERRYFTLVTPYTRSKEILLERAFANNLLSWVLIGGSLRRDLMETFIDAATRHASNALHKLELGEIEPIAFLENAFTYQGETCSHLGVAFAGRIRNIDPYGDLQRTVHSRAHFIRHDLDVSVSLPHNEKTLRLARQYVSAIDFRTVPEFEIEENLRYRARYVFNDAVVKPLMRLAGRVYFPDSLQGLNQRILDMITSGSHEKILDVACGENTAVLDFARLPGTNLVVGNDVSWSQIQLMSNQSLRTAFRDVGSLVLFTNHDARRLPFTDGYFDIALCKNTIHHMDGLPSVVALLKELLRVSKRAIVVEITDPKYESSWGRFRHRYYVDFLHDAGHFFVSPEEFATLTDLPQRLALFQMKTIRGIYQFAEFAREGT